MPTLTRRSIIVIACLACIVTSGACVAVRTPTVAASAENKPCRNGLVVVEQQTDAPLRISILETNCPQLYFANVSFKVEAIGTRPVSRYEVRMSQNANGISDGYSTVVSSVSSGDSLFSPERTATDTLGVTLNRGLFRAPVDELKLFVQSVTFNDGTVWSRAAAFE
jgi:hypothetical protein